MKIKISTNYSLIKTICDSDFKCLREGENITCPIGYTATWDEENVTLEQLQEYVNKGYPIMINC